LESPKLRPLPGKKGENREGGKKENRPVADGKDRGT